MLCSMGGEHVRQHNILWVSEKRRKTWILLVWGWDKEKDWGGGREERDEPPSRPCCGGKVEYWEWAGTLKVLFFPLIPSIRHYSLLLERQEWPAQQWHRQSRKKAVATMIFLLIYSQIYPPLLPKAGKDFVHMKFIDIKQNSVSHLKIY